MKKLCGGGEFYDVLEHMGYQPSTGYYAKRVRWGTTGVRVAVASSLRGPGGSGRKPTRFSSPC